MTRPNVPALSAGACAALLLAGAAQAQMYRHVGPDGRVTYSDQPPVAGAHAVGASAAASGAGGNAALPYQLGQTAQSYPVTLYTASDCAACDAGRSLLVDRGIPFSEKTVESSGDIAALQRLSGSNSLPLLTIGQQRLSGYSDQAWSQYLDAAGYPKTSQLPGSYRRPSATPLAAAAPQPEASAPVPAPAQPPEPSVTPKPDDHNPAGIRF